MVALAIDPFLQAPGPILDVRSPGEYADGHIPGAISFPLFSNEERAQVGICYKHQGREAAVELGFDLAGPKFGDFIRQARSLAPDRRVRVHCWRGGMRSGGMAWALSLAGFEVVTLMGGYKSFRRWVRQRVSEPRPYRVLGGMTGTGKTLILQALAQGGEAMVDLEHWANHRGSSYGGLDMPPQPTTEQFENRIAWDLAALPRDRPVWLEAESRRIGTCRIPEELFVQMDAAPTLEIVRPLAERLTILVDMYGQSDREALVTATERIRKRLGGQRTQAAVALIRAGDLRAALAILLDYYDRTYRYDLERRQKTIPQVDVGGCDAEAAAARLLEQGETLLTMPQTPMETSMETPMDAQPV
jgi:tRNA 2-selenouridine synthase